MTLATGSAISSSKLCEVIQAGLKSCGYLAIVIVLANVIGLSSGTPVLASEYRIAHCLMGCPEGTDNENHLILRPIYALSYNPSTKAADWAAYKISASTIGIASGLSRQTVADEFEIETLNSSDFEGAEESGLLLSRLVPLVNFANTPYWNDVNYLSNVVARSNSLNQGAWYGLEWSIRNLANRGSEVFMLAGPVYGDAETAAQLPTDKQHRVPDAFYKIVMTPEGDWSAFVFGQEEPVHRHHCELRTSVEEIENLTGLDFFPQSPLLAGDSLDSRLGC